MLKSLLVGFPVIVLCLILEGVFVGWCLRYYARLSGRRRKNSHWADFVLLSSVMMLTLLGNCVQMVIWAGLFLALGEFDAYPLALYHSAVNFTTLGYGDIVMSERWRLLGPLEAANGILMFGVSTALMTAAVSDVLKRGLARQKKAASSPS